MFRPMLEPNISRQKLDVMHIIRTISREFWHHENYSDIYYGVNVRSSSRGFIYHVIGQLQAFGEISGEDYL